MQPIHKKKNGITTSANLIYGRSFFLRSSEKIMNQFINTSQIQIPGIQIPLSPFPIELLPTKLKEVVHAVQANTQAPIPLIVSSTLATISLACQGVINVRRPNFMEGPTCLYIVNVCDSGERKSTVDQVLTESIRTFESECSKKYTNQLALYFAKKQIWDQKTRILFASIKKKQKKCDSCISLEEELTSHLLLEPKKPMEIKLIYNDMTPEALKQGLSENGSSAGIFADEGAIFLEGYGRAGLPLYNSIWSGSSIKVDRVSSPSFSLDGVRLTISLMVPDGGFEKFLIRHGDAARSNGFLARCLVTYPVSTQGTRFIQNQLPLKEPIQQFHMRITEILEQTLIRNEQGLSKIVIKFSADAAKRWIEIYNAIEGRMVHGGTCEDIKDYASKMAENLARLAALFNFFENGEDDISLEAPC